MSTQSFDVSLFNKTLTWNAPGQAPAVRGRQMSADGGPSRTAQGDGFAHDAEKAVDRPRSARGLSMECTTGRGLSIECPVCTVTALVFLPAVLRLLHREPATEVDEADDGAGGERGVDEVIAVDFGAGVDRSGERAAA